MNLFFKQLASDFWTLLQFLLFVLVVLSPFIFVALVEGAGTGALLRSGAAVGF